jgi:hypothetical protein
MKSLQWIIDAVYRNPRAKISRFRRFGGYLEYKKMLAGEVDMEMCAERLPPVQSFDDGFPVFFLTGHKYFHQTLYCIRSLSMVAGKRLRITIVDDGSFDSGLIGRVSRQLPGAALITQGVIDQKLNELLPAEIFPNLRSRREVYPHLRKLTDVHTISCALGWKLVLDSDMLFWREPLEIMNWLKNPDRPIYMTDCEECYGYSRESMEALTGDRVPLELNVGVIGLHSGSIDWEKVEYWIGKLEQTQGTSYFLEQALTAMLIGTEPSLVLPAQTYQVNPTGGEPEPECILRHYVDLSKKDYFNRAWRKL